MEGVVLASEQRSLWDKTKTRLLANPEGLRPQATRGDLSNYERFAGRYVEVEGLVDSVDRTDLGHENLRILSEGIRALAVVQRRQTNLALRSEDLSKIFGHGFTTRHGGHGFGLHSPANAARALGGYLAAHSDGPGSGATFTLELPVFGRTRDPH